MGLGNSFPDGSSNDDENSGGSVSYIYIREDDNKEAYHLMSNDGSAFVRNALKSLPVEVAADQHDFFQQMVVALEPVLKNDDYSEILDLLMVDAGNIAQYLDENDQVREELLELIAESEELKEVLEEAD